MEPHATAENNVLVILGPREDFASLLRLLSHEAFAYNPEGLAAARAYDCIREALEAEEVEEMDAVVEGELV